VSRVSCVGDQKFALVLPSAKIGSYSSYCSRVIAHLVVFFTSPGCRATRFGNYEGPEIVPVVFEIRTGAHRITKAPQCP